MLRVWEFGKNGRVGRIQMVSLLGSQGGACPACVQQNLLRTLLSKGDAALHEAIQTVWPLDAEAAFGTRPTRLRLHADPRFSGKA